jgi:hypothetical protein
MFRRLPPTPRPSPQPIPFPAQRPAGHGRRVLRRVVGAVVLVAVTVLVAAGPSPAFADAGRVLADPPVPVGDLGQVVNNIRTWLFTILVAVATLFATLGAVRLLAANGDPTEVEKGKSALKSAALGYGLAILAPLLVTIVGSWLVA